MKNNMKKIAALVLALLMAALCLTACGGSKVTLKVNDGGTVTEVEISTDTKIADVLSDAGIKLGDKDISEPAADSEVTADLKEIIVKRYAKVTVVKDGVEKTVELVGGTVEEAVKAAGFTLAAGDEPDADLKANLKDGMVISFDGNVEYKEEKVVEAIPYTTQEEYSEYLPTGQQEITQTGEDGEKEVTYKVKYVDGKEISREVISENITKESVDEIVVIGIGTGRYEVRRDRYDDCDGSGHGYFEIYYSDGSTEYEVY